MGDENFTFFTTNQLFEVGHRALAIFDATKRNFGDPENREKDSAHDAAHAMLMACAECIAHARDAALWPLALAIIDRLPDDASLWRRWEASGTGSLKGFAGAGPRLKELQDLASDPRAHVRLAVARALPVETPEQIAVVSMLAADEDGKVSAAAREQLEGVEIPFWVGKFSADPFAGMTDEQAAAAKRPIEKVCKLLEEPFWSERAQNAFMAAARALPHPLELDVLTRAALGERLRYAIGTGPIETRLAMLGDAGAEAALQIFTSPRRHDSSNARSAEDYGKGLPPLEARRILPRWLERLRATRADQDAFGSLAHCFASAIGEGWPATEDPRPVLDAILERADPGAFNIVVSALSSAIQRNTRHDLLVPRLEPALRSGFPHGWSEIAHSCRTFLKRTPKPELRSLAERTLDGRHEESLAWACGILLNEAFDAKRDGTRARRAARLDADPRTRRAMRTHHPVTVLPELRAELVRGALDFELAGTAMQAIGELYGGMFVHADRDIVLGNIRSNDEPLVLPDGRGLVKFDRGEHLPYLGPAKLRQPASPDEWHAWRTVRAEHVISDDRDLELGLFGIEFGSDWHPADRAYFERATEHLRTHPGPRAEWRAATAAAILAVKGAGRDLPLMRELRRIGARTEDIVGVRLERVLEHFRGRFGLRAVATPRPPKE